MDYVCLVCFCLFIVICVVYSVFCFVFCIVFYFGGQLTKFDLSLQASLMPTHINYVSLFKILDVLNLKVAVISKTTQYAVFNGVTTLVILKIDLTTLSITWGFMNIFNLLST